MTAFDVVVIGSGANGLTAATALGRAGRRVLVLEANDIVGGLAASVEFHPGYRSAGVLHDTTLLRPAVVSELELERHGLELRPAPPRTLICGGGQATALADHADALAGLTSFIDRLRPVLAGFADQPPLDILALESESVFDLLKRGLALRRLGKRDMLELMRVAPMCVADFLREWLESEPLMAAMAMPAVAASFTAPRSPGTTANFLLLSAMRGPGSAGGSHRLIAALEKAATSAGAEIRTNAAAKRIEVAGGRVSGVTLANGDLIECSQVMAACDPRTALLDLVKPMHLSARLEERLHHYRCRGTTAHLLLATSDDLASLDGAERLSVADSLDDIERAFDPIKYRECPERPVLDVAVASNTDPSLCPDGHGVLSIHAHFVPADLDEGGRRALEDAIVARLAETIPALPDAIVGSSLSMPTDLAARYHLTGGNLHHGERAIDQLLVRPVPECSAYATPIEGLTLCGGGTHPGGGLHGGCGRLAAKAIS